MSEKKYSDEDWQDLVDQLIHHALHECAHVKRPAVTVHVVREHYGDWEIYLESRFARIPTQLFPVFEILLTDGRKLLVIPVQKFDEKGVQDIGVRFQKELATPPTFSLWDTPAVKPPFDIAFGVVIAKQRLSKEKPEFFVTRGTP